MSEKVLSVNNYSTETYPSLPYDGWLKPCYYCKEITANILIKNSFKYYICRKCTKRIKLKSEIDINSSKVTVKLKEIQPKIELSNNDKKKCGCILT